ETLTERPAFKTPFQRRRCLVLADGFYEWRTAGRVKIPTLFHLGDREAFAFAGLWDAWKTPEGTEMKSFTILTTTANETVRPLHDRMPVILSREDEDL